MSSRAENRASQTGWESRKSPATLGTNGSFNAETEIRLSYRESVATYGFCGCGVLFLGPGDYGILAGIPAQMDHPKIQAAMEQIASTAKATGKHWGMPNFSPEHAKQFLELAGAFYAMVATCS